ncbi:hypothetical protein C8R41DRAFT_822404 [Lentinula lateritia]|uniref:Isopenicillin N synthase-like Fe(2+) 2OG dioxygenase domain-containing protein n=1 Tax=Lentinula lateritia TaxID=40482 RepID=A0ABQ8VM67_9AGAR|nr:hypothetical protein C8R41DRAFT_822404 [Lentinula lateritia]
MNAHERTKRERERRTHRRNAKFYLPLGTVLFNIGDFLMRWSNDTLKTTLHRVSAPPRRDGQG